MMRSVERTVWSMPKSRPAGAFSSRKVPPCATRCLASFALSDTSYAIMMTLVCGLDGGSRPYQSVDSCETGL